MREMRHELREGEKGEAEVWTNLGDILEWLDSLPNTNNRIAASVALEIRQMLYESVVSARRG